MKGLVLILLFVLVCNSHQRTFNELQQMWNGKMLRPADICRKETNVDSALISKMILNGEYVNDHNLMCYVKCIFYNLHLANMNGSLNKGNFVHFLSLEHDDLQKSEIQEKCFNIRVEDKCETLFRILECTHKAVENVMTAAENK